ncbi:MAG TPA: glycoside hydrolase family 38 C-terminal domain-containing protein, partial [Bacteroidota bacterium]|nr:glycoside hydrolase family 38 C-terminal domain-containing protein [Bacteroidota bacterium]
TEAFSPVLKNIMPRTIYLLPHAHNDIGYTNIQTEVLKRHVQNIRDAMALIRKTAGYPPEARFKWNIEVNWAVETFMNEASGAERDEFLRDCRDGSICIEALYANVLTGIMRPEDFYRATEYARAFREKYRVPLNTAMISDIPGMTWNMVPALAEAGIRYFSAGPNGVYTGGDRTGHTNAAWSDRPFYWRSPSGEEKILYWMAGYGYASLFTGPRNPDNVRFLRDIAKYFDHLDAIAYPYAMIQMRHTFNGDNGTVDPGLSDYVRTWNKTLFSPKLAIATTEELFTNLEHSCGACIPGFKGDFTPYWEDGAASTAYELGVNRTTAERLVQAEALYALIAPAQYSPAAFSAAWRNVVLFDEHTWGAFNSTSDPDSPFVVRQWEIKQAFALDGAREADSLLARIVPSGPGASGSVAFDVLNTNSWERTDIVLLAREASAGRDVVRDEEGAEVPSQRLTTGELAFLARGVPALGSRRYTLGAGTPSFRSDLRAEEGALVDSGIAIRLDRSTGEIASLRTFDPPIEYVDTAGGRGLDGYFYVAGLDACEALRSGPPSVAVGEKGPLVASIVVTSGAPGCNSLRREYRLVDGLGRLDVTNTIDKRRVRTNEAVHVGFPFNVPGGTMRVDLGLAVIRPEADQLPGSCKDYYSAQRWADVSNQDFGVTLTVSEAPLVEMGDLHSELPAPRNVDWKTFRPYSSHLASYVMNNYWYTNYKADQEGVSTYHYSILPHALFNQAEAERAGIERSQPLVARRVRVGEPKLIVPFTLSPGGIIVTSLEPAEGGKALLVRLFNTGGAPEAASFAFPGGKGSVYMSGLDGKRGARVNDIRLPANGIAIVLVEEESR